jgi:hypothetical protein
MVRHLKKQRILYTGDPGGRGGSALEGRAAIIGGHSMRWIGLRRKRPIGQQVITM